VVYRAFEVPGDDELFSQLGQRSSQVPDEEPTVRQLVFRTPTGPELLLVYDLIGRSIRFKLFEHGSLIVDGFREGAVRMTTNRFAPRTLVVEFKVDGTPSSMGMVGTIEFQFADSITIKDQLLLA
jgi:hypothetical protein